MQNPERAEPGRSAFAAAFFSALQPGLGQAYARSWMRALVWAAPSILFYALILGVIRSMGLKDFELQFASSTWEIGILVLLVVDVAYRGAAAVSAFRIVGEGQVQGRRRSAARTVSASGLLAVCLVLVMFHVALGQGVYSALSLGAALGSGDTTPVVPISSLPPDLQSLLPTTLPPTATPEPGVTPGPTDTPEPTPTQGPPWNGTDRLNVLLIGADAGRPGYSGYLTDTMMLLSVDPPTGRVALISLPRDTQGIPLPKNWAAYNAYGGIYPYKINTLYTIARSESNLFPGNDQQRGYMALMGALSQLYGVEIDYYVAIDLSGFRDVVNTLGGVVVDVQVPVYDTHYPTSDGRGSEKLYITPGIQYMDGRAALAYARARHATSDFDRAARQQRVVTSLREQTDLSTLLAPGVLTEIFAEIKSDVRTNIPQDQFPKFLSLAQSVDFNRRISLVLTPPTFSTECYPCPPSGLYILKANVPAIHNAVQNIFKTNPKVEEQRQEIQAEGAVVSVLNGTPGSNAKTTNVANALATYGIDATVPPINGGSADRPDYTDTVITAYNGVQDDLPTTISVLENLFGVTVQTADDANQAADIVIVVGSSTSVPPPGD
jgi:LCP family protein required for cell wall assembly